MKNIPYIYIVLVLLTLNSQAQHSISLNDTLRINEVIVTGKPVLRASGFTKTVIDSSLIRDNINTSLADILRSGSPMFVKTYGPGGIATVSLRGAGASHTVVIWNGISLNSPMIGQTDFMLLPALLADEITVYNGGSSVAVAQGGLGGVVDVVTSPEWNRPEKHEIFLSTGSYGRYSTAYIGRYGTGNWRFTSRVGYNLARNNFRYVNQYLTDEAVSEKRDNAAFRQKVAVQEAWHKGNRSVTGIKIWLQESRRDIPVPVNVSPSSHDEHLSNLSLFSYMNHDYFFAKDMVWSSVASFQSDRMHYQDLVTGIDSPSSFNRISLKSTLLINKGEKTALKASLSAEAGTVESLNYSTGVSRHMASVSLAVDHRLNRVSNVNINSVMSMVDGNILSPDISAGFEIKPVTGSDLALKTNIAAKTRVPSMNDLYWIPGGNEMLKPERGYSGEISFDYTESLYKNLKINLFATTYLNSVRNMIVWQPGTGGIWSPENIGTIISRGVESGSSLSLESGSNYIRLMMTYTNTVSREADKNEQLIYVPRHMSYGEIRAATGRLIAGTSLQCTGKRYVAADNTRYLPAFAVTDLWVGIRSNNNKIPFDVTVRFENLFNINYQIVAYHPMPPGAILLNLSLKSGIRDNK
ncbi:MAG: TonB-dependent receptor [Bacteroidales bacterium]